MYLIGIKKECDKIVSKLIFHKNILNTLINNKTILNLERKIFQDSVGTDKRKSRTRIFISEYLKSK